MFLYVQYIFCLFHGSWNDGQCFLTIFPGGHELPKYPLAVHFHLSYTGRRAKMYHLLKSAKIWLITNARLKTIVLWVVFCHLDLMWSKTALWSFQMEQTNHSYIHRPTYFNDKVSIPFPYIFLCLVILKLTKDPKQTGLQAGFPLQLPFKNPCIRMSVNFIGFSFSFSFDYSQSLFISF